MSYAEAMHEFRILADTLDVYERLFDQVEKDIFVGVQSVISIGSGEGVVDLMFVKRCVPNITKFTAVDKDVYSLEKLKKNFKNSFTGHVILNTHLSLGETWQGPNEADGRADLVLLFHCLYFFEEQERLRLYKRCFEDWLNPGRKVLVMHEKDLIGTKTPFFMNDIYRRTARKPLIESHTIMQELVDSGFCIEKDYRYEYDQNLTLLNDHALSWICLMADPPYEDNEVVKRTVKTLIDEGNVGYTSGAWYCVGKKGDRKFS